ncbi:hypothetical protein FALBO_13654 [Fusarium albosuccineum]|uniref:Xylanolytic transcriptional activator regulatory domain-containing protein n=1 Tax=Fusarium albosuccineum TaxID=1237068 RepID=A0A8H4L0R9_9HYPO|nr:hypothetical protein FALBO_13654 [Fusarium albosuccineum]
MKGLTSRAQAMNVPFAVTHLRAQTLPAATVGPARNETDDRFQLHQEQGEDIEPAIVAPSQNLAAMASLAARKMTPHPSLSFAIFNVNLQPISKRISYASDAKTTRLSEPSELPFNMRSFSFLLRYTNPENNTMQDFFGVSDSSLNHNWTFDVNQLEFSKSTGDAALPCLDLVSQEPSFPQEIVTLDSFFEQHEPSGRGEDGPRKWTIGRSHLENNDDVLEAKLKEIASALSSTNCDDISFGAHQNRMDSIDLLFQRDKIGTFVSSYFTNWHHNCPLLHRPSFDISSISPPLLTAVALMGAIYASKNSAAAARICLNAAETYIFDHSQFRELTQGLTQQALEHSFDHIAPLQAAIIISVLQHWENHSDSRHRIRLHRFPAIVQAARDLRLTTLRHSPEATINVPQTSERWARTPPRVALTEMTGSLPCPEYIFDKDFVELERLPRSRLTFDTLPCAAECVAILLTDRWTEDMFSRFRQLDCLNLFILVSGLHEVIFSTLRAGCLENVEKRIKQALSRWKILWDLGVEKHGDPKMGCTGFFRNADEYWWLANMFLQKTSPVAANREGDLVGQDGMTGINTFIKQFAKLNV